MFIYLLFLGLESVTNCTLFFVGASERSIIFVFRKRLMNSPLFFRKVLRTQIEPDFQNLETFQKSQIKNKVIKII